MKVLTEKQKRDIGIRLIALLRMGMAMAKHLPAEQYAEYVDKFMDAIADIAMTVGGIELMEVVGRKGLEG